MAYEERRVVSDADPVDTESVVRERRVVEPDAVAERRPRTTVVHDDDPVTNVYAATQLIHTIVWSIVVLVLLVVALLALHVYAHLF